eukprot:350770-Chlamydomonas_euryale.AAC.2
MQQSRRMHALWFLCFPLHVCVVIFTFPSVGPPQVCIVTGAESGIGFATSHQLARMGAHVIIASRNTTRSMAAVEVCPLRETCGAGKGRGNGMV